MEIDRKRKVLIWLLWAIIFPLGIWYSFQLVPLQPDFRSIDFLIFVVLMVSASLIPIVVNNTPMSITQWISLVVFLKYGLFAELILGQIVVLVVLLRVKLPKEESYRYALNSTMFAIISICSALIFYALGGTHQTYTIQNVSFLILAGVYLLSSFVLNQLVLVMLHRIFIRNNRPFYSQDMLWEAMSLLVVLPLGFVLYFLYNSIGIFSAILVGIPVISALLILNIYNKSSQKNTFLKKAVAFGHLLTERLKSEEVLEVFVENLLKMFQTDYLYVLDNVDGENLEVIRSYEKGQTVRFNLEPIRKNEGLIGKVWGSEKGEVYESKSEWEQLVKGILPTDAQSIMIVPMIKNNDVTGMTILLSCKKRVFTKYHLMIVDILCSYLAIALENARHYEQTKFQSERDPLTNLFNARVYNEKLEETGQKVLNGELENMSVLLIDIDHFKSVNDTYGHQSGNTILCDLAEILKIIVGNKGTLARYGGEEFAILLPNYSKEEAIRFGEHIRQTIQNRAFNMFDDLAEVRRKLTARITVSIGVASMPEDTDDAHGVMRYADRALYIGAKRVGRNKVAEYVS